MAILVLVAVVVANQTVVDPHEAAHDILDAYNETQRANGEPMATFVSAEWREVEGR